MVITVIAYFAAIFIKFTEKIDPTTIRAILGAAFSAAFLIQAAATFLVDSVVAVVIVASAQRSVAIEAILDDTAAILTIIIFLEASFTISISAANSIGVKAATTPSRMHQTFLSMAGCVD